MIQEFSNATMQRYVELELINLSILRDTLMYTISSYTPPLRSRFTDVDVQSVDDETASSRMILTADDLDSIFVTWSTSLVLGVYSPESTATSIDELKEFFVSHLHESVVSGDITRTLRRSALLYNRTCFSYATVSVLPVVTFSVNQPDESNSERSVYSVQLVVTIAVVVTFAVCCVGHVSLCLYCGGHKVASRLLGRAFGNRAKLAYIEPDPDLAGLSSIVPAPPPAAVSSGLTLLLPPGDEVHELPSATADPPPPAVTVTTGFRVPRGLVQASDTAGRHVEVLSSAVEVVLGADAHCSSSGVDCADEAGCRRSSSGLGLDQLFVESEHEHC